MHTDCGRSDLVADDVTAARYAVLAKQTATMSELEPPSLHDVVEDDVERLASILESGVADLHQPYSETYPATPRYFAVPMCHAQLNLVW